ncbi:MAG: CotH kinase family protein [Flavobacteriales bacterium]|nr:CotH kinase family protein [Flavobacteriales bacterium]
MLLRVPAFAQGPMLVINAVQSVGAPHDHIELYNAGGSVIALEGIRLHAGSLRHQFPPGLLLGGHERMVLHATADDGSSALHIPWLLPDDGGTLLLLAADGFTLLDVFTYPVMPRGWSMARYPAGGTDAIFLPDRAMCSTLAVPQNDEPHTAATPIPVWTLMLDPGDLYDPERGIDVEGAHANYSRKGRNWARLAQLATPEDTLAQGVSVRIAGNGSRSLAKRSFRIDRKDAGAEPWHFDAESLVLRADAQGHAILNNLLMQELVARAGRHVDVLPSMPVRLTMNQEQRGLYRVMPRRTSKWFGRDDNQSRIALVNGPMLETDSSGLRQCLERLRHGDRIEDIQLCLDLESMIDMACMDLFTGRVDHDLNQCAWRMDHPEGRWRWVMHDMDLWGGMADNSVDLHCTAPANETSLVRELMRHPRTRTPFLSRLQALLSTVLSPPSTLHISDSLYAHLVDALWEDHRIWAERMDRPDPDQARAALAYFLEHRPHRLLRHLSEHMQDPIRTIRITAPPTALGWVEWDGLRLPPGTAQFHVLRSVPVRLRAVPAEGMEFVEWKELEDAGPAIVVEPGARSITAVFRPAAASHRHRLQ